MSGPIEHYQALWLQAQSEPHGLAIECSDPGKLRMALHRAKARLGTGDDIEMQAYPAGTLDSVYPLLVLSRSMPLKARRGRPPKSASPCDAEDDILGDLGL